MRREAPSRPVFRAMARMIGELERDPESGFPGKVGRLVATKDEESARERIAAPAP